jgi:GxxExxY protein
MERSELTRSHKATEKRSVTENETGKIVVACAVKLHKELGPGLLESVYEVLLAPRLESKGLKVERQVHIPIEYDGIRFNEGFRGDLIVEGKVLLELKSVERTTRAHQKQVLTYLKLTDIKLGYLLNFGESLMKEGIHRVLNGALD